jgi:RNA polymerase sigma-70 factor (ECF subfamily)
MNKEVELRALMVASIGGDSVAHRTLLKALAGHLRSYYRGKLARAGREAETEDLVQEALMAVHTRRHTYDPGQLLTPWVYAIARYKLIDYLRRTRASMTDVPIEDAGEITARDDSVAAESALDLAALLTQLPEKVRLSIQYVKLDGLSVAEAAARCGISNSAVKINIFRGLKTLASLIAVERDHEHG